ncbi:hypothetical protein WAJ08_21200, partial [Acinetobacter baumannii]
MRRVKLINPAHSLVVVNPRKRRTKTRRSNVMARKHNPRRRRNARRHHNPRRRHAAPLGISYPPRRRRRNPQ